MEIKDEVEVANQMISKYRDNSILFGWAQFNLEHPLKCVVGKEKDQGQNNAIN